MTNTFVRKRYVRLGAVVEVSFTTLGKPSPATAEVGELTVSDQLVELVTDRRTPQTKSAESCAARRCSDVAKSTLGRADPK
jgi:hypothetical protein